MTTTSTTEVRNGTWEVLTEQTTASFTVRNFGLIRVHGTIAVEEGQVTVQGGRPAAASAALDPASVSTGKAKRDADLNGSHFFATATHPQVRVQVGDVRPDGDGWTATATIYVAGGRAPVDLRVRRAPDPATDTVRVIATGVLDRSATPINVPRVMVGRFISIEVDATLRLT